MEQAQDNNRTKENLRKVKNTLNYQKNNHLKPKEKTFKKAAQPGS